MYKFCRIDLFGRVSPWTLEIDSFDKYKEWHQKFQTRHITLGLEDIKKRSEEWKEQGVYDKMHGHWTSHVAMLSEFVGGDEEEMDLIEGFRKVVNDFISSKYLALKNEGTIYIYEGCQWFVKPKECNIVETIEKNIMTYPKYGKEDITILKWPGGVHYYANIGGNSITDDYGNVKWNTYNFAYEKALEALTKEDLK